MAEKKLYQLTHTYKSGGWDDDVATSTHLFYSSKDQEDLPDTEELCRLMGIDLDYEPDTDEITIEQEFPVDIG